MERRLVIVSIDTLRFHDDLRADLVDPARQGKAKLRRQLHSGDSLHRASGTWMKREQVLDKDSDRYRKLVYNPETGEVVRHADHPLSEHRGRGSARNRKCPTEAGDVNKSAQAPSPKIRTVAEWVALPEVNPPVVSGEAPARLTLTVHSVGLHVADLTDCCSASLDVKPALAGKALLPHAYILMEHGALELHRLPPSLADWVSSCLSLAQDGVSPLPSQVEFWVLNSEAYAEIR